MIEITLPKVILIADDDPDTRNIVSSAVEMMGYTPMLACDGTAALKMFDQVTPDAAILDVMMPGLTGLEVCDKVKAREDSGLIPILILTARDSMHDKVSALEDGADDYLTKPFHIQELQARITALLRVRELNLQLQKKNKALQAMQERLIEQERQLVATQLAGTAAHRLGQPIAAMILNCHLLETLSKDSDKYKTALSALKADLRHLSDLIEKLRGVDARETKEYHQGTNILDIDK